MTLIRLSGGSGFKTEINDNNNNNNDNNDNNNNNNNKYRGLEQQTVLEPFRFNL